MQNIPYLAPNSNSICLTADISVTAPASAQVAATILIVTNAGTGQSVHEAETW